MWLDILITVLLVSLAGLAMLPRWLSHENRYLSEVLKASPDIQTIRLRHGDTHYQLKGESMIPS